MTFLHGVEVLTIDSGRRPITTVRSSVIGLIGTAPDADASVFPLNTPVLIAGTRLEAAKLDNVGDGNGTLPAAIDAIFDQAGAVVVVIRVEEGETDQETLANILGGIDAATGGYTGVQAFLASASVLGYTPRILIAPGFTGNRPEDPENAGAYLANPVVSELLPIAERLRAVIIADGPDANDGAAIAWAGDFGSQRVYLVDPGVKVTDNDGNITNRPASARVAGLIAKSDNERGFWWSPSNREGPNTTDAAAITWAGDFGSRRVYVVDPAVKVTDDDGNITSQPASARVAGMIAKSDNERGFWWSPSNREISGIVGTTRPVDFTFGDANCRANLLNEQNVATIIRQDGYRLWGNRTLSSDPLWAFLSHVRTHDMILESLLQAHLWAVDRNITKTYVEDVSEGVNAYLATLAAKGAISGGRCWADPELNTAEVMDGGQVYFDFDYGRYGVAEHVTFRAMINNDYTVESIFGSDE